MKKFLQWLVGIIFIFALVILIMPYFSGILTASRLKQVVGEFDNTTSANIKIIEYKRHWFSADAVAIMNLDKTAVGASLQQIVITAHITHGPLILSYGSVHFAQGWVKGAAILKSPVSLGKQSAKQIQIATIDMRVNLTGGSKINIASKPFTFKNSNGILEWQGLDATFSMSSDCKRRSGKLNLQGINVVLDNFSFKIHNFTENYNETKSKEALWVGNNEIFLGSLVLVDNDKEKKQLQINNFAMQTAFREHLGLIKGNAKFNVSEVILNDKAYQNIVFNWNINKFNEKIFADIGQVFAKEQKKTLSSFAVLQLKDSFALFTKLLASGAQINIEELSFVSPSGKFTLEANLSADPGIEKADNILGMLANVNLEVKLAVAKPLAKSLLESFYGKNAAEKNIDPKAYVTAELQELEQDGKIISKDDNYLLKINYNNGKLLINNKKFSILN